LPSDARVVAVAGEAVADLVATAPGSGPAGGYLALPGGSPANVAVGLARLGVPTRMVARVSADPFGRMLRDHLATNGVDTATVVHATEPSSVAFVHNEADGYDLRIAGTADWQWSPGELTTALDGGVCALHVGSLAMVMSPGAEPLGDLVRHAGVTVSYDPNCRPGVMAGVPGARARIEALMRAADIVKLSDADLEWLRPGAAPADIAEELLAAGVSLVGVTLGADGALVAGQGLTPRRVPAHPVDVVDTVGAGDSYMSAVLAGLHRRGLLGGGLRTAPSAALTGTFAEAARAAALTCGRRGADPPTAADLSG
jgi:fructokinase